MSSASVEVVRSILAANERGEYGSTEWAHPDIDFVVADGRLRAAGPGWRE